MAKAVTLKIDGAKAAKKAVKEFGKAANGAMQAAAKRAVDSAKSQIAKSIRKRYVVEADDVKKSIAVAKNATLDNLVITLRLRGSLQTIYHHFEIVPAHRPPKSVGRYSIATSIKKGKTATFTRRVFLPTTNARKQKTQLWFRQGPSRHSPVTPLHTLSVAQMLNDDAKEEVNKKAGEVLMKRFQHEMDFRLGKLTKKGGGT